jgi:hypothetical protein
MGMEKKYDLVKKPKHYNREGAMECFDEFVLIYGIEAAKHACLFNIHKYRYRAANKNGEEDLEKSDWYINKYKELCEIDNIKNKNALTLTTEPKLNDYWLSDPSVKIVPCNTINTLYTDKSN